MHGVAVLTLAHRWGSSRSVLLAICSAVCKLLQPWDMVLHLSCRAARLSLLVAKLLLLCSFALHALPAKRHAMGSVCLRREQLGQDSVWTHQHTTAAAVLSAGMLPDTTPTHRSKASSSSSSMRTVVPVVGLSWQYQLPHPG